MKTGAIFFLCSAFFIKCASARAAWRTSLGYGSGQSEFWSCWEIQEDIVYDYVSTGHALYSSSYDSICNYPPAIGNLLICAMGFANISGVSENKIFNVASNACTEYSSFPNDAKFFEEQYINATKFEVPLNSLNLSEPVYSTTVLNYTSEFNLEYFEGYQKYYYNVDSGTWFSVAIYAYFLLLIIIGAIHNFARQTGFVKNVNKWSISKKIQSYVTIPALFPNGKFSDDYTIKLPFTNMTIFTILYPNRIQFLVDAGLFFMQIGFYCAPYGQNVGGALFGTVDAAWKRFVADRTGIMAYGKIPLLVLFAGRNNFLLWATGWSYTTFLHYHKIVALWMAIDSLIHSVAYTIDVLGYYVVYLQDLYFAAGVALTVVLFVMCGGAVREIRRRWYSWFLVFHVLFGVAFMVLAWYHVRTLGWAEYLIASWVIWGADRIFRILRMAIFGFNKANITIVDETEKVIKLQLTKPAFWNSQPGQFGFIYFGGLKFWENNPFTVIQKDNELIAYIKTKEGVTEEIYNKVLKAGGNFDCRVCIEGPYGTESSTKGFDNELFIAGGAGASGVIDAASKASQGKNQGKLLWVIREIGMLEAYKDVLSTVSIPIDVYLTRSRENSVGISDDSSEDKQEVGTSTKSFNNVTIHHGRPDMKNIINRYVNESNSSVAILGCGPPSMMDDIRAIVAEGVSKWENSVEYFDELQVW
ncbi:hypothetical protein DAMA08_000130 [Martiniozyma asiatica (nom. inval.)]|nr:hypothetical protein DAMA08_000130 [Martiniozyma asiatica]